MNKTFKTSNLPALTCPQNCEQGLTIEQKNLSEVKTNTFMDFCQILEENGSSDQKKLLLDYLYNSNSNLFQKGGHKETIWKENNQKRKNGVELE